MMAGKTGTINLQSKLKTFMRKEFPGYRFVGRFSYLKALTDELRGRLEFVPVYHAGVGKAFTLNYAMDAALIGSQREQFFGSRFSLNIFQLFQKERQHPQWIYSTADDLEQKLSALKIFLSRVVPVIEDVLIDRFSPWPTFLPVELPVYGDLTAKEAVDVALSGARAVVGTDRLEFAGVITDVDLPLRESIGPGITNSGRIQVHGYWSVDLLLPERDQYMFLKVPHTGNIQTGIYPRHDHLNPIISEAWLDSPSIAPLFMTVWKNHIGRAEHHAFHLGFWLRSIRPGRPYWDIHLSATERKPTHRYVTIFVLSLMPTQVKYYPDPS
jgi:hypothetical protein